MRHTQFESTPEGRFYTPHAYIGLIVTALFLGRLVYRVAGVPIGASGDPQPADPLSVYRSSPLTFAVLSTLVAYYLTYYVGVLRRTRALAIGD
jgi:hypothetical protein